MKKLLLPTILILALAVGGYFVFFVDSDEKPNNDNGQTLVEDTKNTSDTPEKDTPPTPEELEKQKRLMEHARPQEFVDLRYSSRRNLLGESIIEGSLKNNADLTTYKDLQLMIYFEDEENTEVDSASQVVFETIVPGEEKTFKLKEKGPKKTSVRLDIVDAKIFE